MPRLLRAVVSRSALKHNVGLIRQLAPQSKILAMIKANAYGHDSVIVAKALSEVDAFGVAFLEEARRLREAGISQRIILMEGFFHPEEIDEMEALKVEAVIHHEFQVTHLQHQAKHRDKPLSLWLKVNTGMNRLGFLVEEFSSIWQKIQKLPGIVVEGLMTHFSHADQRENPKTQDQIDRFSTVVKDLPVIKSLANSAGILGWKDAHAEWVRPGIMLYGVSPFAKQQGSDFGLKPAMKFEAQLISIQTVRAGETIGYEGRYCCPKDMRVGVVAVGYADGYPQNAPSGTPLWVADQRVPLVGRVSMDMLTIDLSDCPGVQIGAPVELWGPHIPVEEISQAVGRSAYELLTGLTARVPAVAVDDLN